MDEKLRDELEEQIRDIECDLEIAKDALEVECEKREIYEDEDVDYIVKYENIIHFWSDAQPPVSEISISHVVVI